MAGNGDRKVQTTMLENVIVHLSGFPELGEQMLFPFGKMGNDISRFSFNLSVDCRAAGCVLFIRHRRRRKDYDGRAGHGDEVSGHEPFARSATWDDWWSGHRRSVNTHSLNHALPLSPSCKISSIFHALLTTLLSPGIRSSHLRASVECQVSRKLIYSNNTVTK